MSQTDWWSSGWVSATKTEVLISIPSLVKPKTIKIDIRATLLYVSRLKETEASTVCGRQVAAWFEGWKVPLMSPGQINVVNKGEITIILSIRIDRRVGAKAKSRPVRSSFDDWLIDASLSSYHEKATVRYPLDESAPA